MGVKINVERARRKVLPEADYVCNIVVCEQAIAKGSGAPKLHIEYTVDPEYHPEFADIRLISDISLQEQSWYRVLELVEAAVGEMEPDEKGDIEFEPSELVGCQVAVQVWVDDSYNGIPRNRVGAVYPVSEYGKQEEVEGGEEI